MGATTTPAPAAPVLPANAKTFIDGVLRGVNAPVTAQNELGMYYWLANEQGGPTLSTFSQNQGNPLGVQTASALASGRSGNLQGGINATVANLRGGMYPGILAALRKGNSADAVVMSVVASPWNGNHYGGLQTFLNTAGAPKSSNGMFLPVGGSASLAAGPTGGASPTPTAKQLSGHGCGSKVGGNPGAPNNLFTIPHTSAGLTYCEAKAILGAFALTAGGFLMVVGLITLVAGGKGGGVAGRVATTFTPVGRAVGAVSRVGKRA